LWCGRPAGFVVRRQAGRLHHKMAKILLVEDNEQNRDMLARRLARQGHAVVTAPDGERAIAMAGSESPDVILMDLNLPVLDGWVATRRIKDSPMTRSIPVIALTAHAMSGDRQRALNAGCDDYDTKPIDFARLIGKISALVKPPCEAPAGAERPAQVSNLKFEVSNLKSQIRPATPRRFSSWTTPRRTGRCWRGGWCGTGTRWRRPPRGSRRCGCWGRSRSTWCCWT
jgi:CheY-like chemotaxis protein